MVTLLAQINYIVDVAANMPADTHTTASRVFRLAWRGKQTSTTIVVLADGQHVLAQPPEAGYSIADQEHLQHLVSSRPACSGLSLVSQAGTSAAAATSA